MKEKAEAEGTHLTVEEARQALASISRADMIRLRKAEIWWSRDNDNSMLLVDAITKTWDGVRSWKRGMTPFTHLYGVMKSLASNDYKKTKKNKTDSITDDAGNEKPKISAQISTPSPETLMIEREQKQKREKEAKELADQVLELFADDDNAMWVLMGEMDGQSAEEIRELSGMDQTQYNSTRRRIRRKLDRYFPDKKKT